MEADLNVRDIGPIRPMDRQPLQGRDGLRMGEMERGAVIHHALGFMNIYQQNLPKPQA